MIIFYAEGRLGNQLFQLAFLQKIAKYNELILTFNLKNFFCIFNLKNNKIKVFNYNFRTKLLKSIFRKLYNYFFETISYFRLITIIFEKKGSIDASFESKLGILWFIRYVRSDFFQSEKFFDKDEILDNFKIKEIYLKEAQNILSKIPISFTKVFIHVRRGDYLKEVYLGDRDISLPINYFKKAISIIESKVSNPYYIILSDDVYYCSKSFNYLAHKKISKNEIGVDLAIMANCDCGITSNSSFSWWGAFFINRNSFVVMPKYWYGWKKKVHSHKGIYLSNSNIIDF